MQLIVVVPLAAGSFVMEVADTLGMMAADTLGMTAADTLGTAAADTLGMVAADTHGMAEVLDCILGLKVVGNQVVLHTAGQGVADRGVLMGLPHMVGLLEVAVVHRAVQGSHLHQLRA